MLRVIPGQGDRGQRDMLLEAEPDVFFLTDTTDPNRGNFHVVPGSHLRNAIDLPDDGVSEPEGATPVRVPAGTAAVSEDGAAIVGRLPALTWVGYALAE